jgi:hypothetical protein
MMMLNGSGQRNSQQIANQSTTINTNGSNGLNLQSNSNSSLMMNGNGQSSERPNPPKPPKPSKPPKPNALTIQQQTKQQDLSDSSMFDMPLPPPPLDLQDSGHSNPHLHTNGKNYFYDKP